MIIYEVNLKVSREVFDEYKHWLKSHIQEMLKFPGFIEARCLQEYQNENSEEGNLTVQYAVNSKENLDAYLTHHASKMREEGQKKFPEKFSATRRIFNVLECSLGGAKGVTKE